MTTPSPTSCPGQVNEICKHDAWCCLNRLVCGALVITAPLSLLVMLFPALVIVRSAQCLFGSLRLAERNSLTYSGRAPEQARLPAAAWAEVLIFVVCYAIVMKGPMAGCKSP